MIVFWTFAFRKRWLAAALPLLTILAGCASLKSPPANAGPKFSFPTNTFAFANETVLAYSGGEHVTEHRAQPPKYTRSCFVMAAAAVQFWKTARFEPYSRPTGPEELARRIHAVVRRGTWEPPLPDEQRIVFYGYRNLWDLSAREPQLVQANLGPGWVTYFHPHKYAMQFVPSPTHQQRLHAAIDDWLAHSQVMVVWLYNFPHVNINHAVVVYAADGTNAYKIYDPNFTDRPRRLEFNPVTKQFSYEPTFYFPGGPVKVRAVYLNVVH